MVTMRLGQQVRKEADMAKQQPDMKRVFTRVTDEEHEAMKVLAASKRTTVDALVRLALEKAKYLPKDLRGAKGEREHGQGRVGQAVRGGR